MRPANIASMISPSNGYLCRRDRNRAAALSSYYQRKAQRQRLELQAAALRTDMAGLATVLRRLQDDVLLGAIVRPLLLSGMAAADILSHLDALV